MCGKIWTIFLESYNVSHMSGSSHYIIKTQFSKLNEKRSVACSKLILCLLNHRKSEVFDPADSTLKVVAFWRNSRLNLGRHCTKLYENASTLNLFCAGSKHATIVKQTMFKNFRIWSILLKKNQRSTSRTFKEKSG